MSDEEYDEAKAGLLGIEYKPAQKDEEPSGGGGGGGGPSIEFLGLWRDTGDRAMPIKMNVNPGNPNQVR